MGTIAYSRLVVAWLALLCLGGGAARSEGPVTVRDILAALAQTADCVVACGTEEDLGRTSALPLLEGRDAPSTTRMLAALRCAGATIVARDSRYAVSFVREARARERRGVGSSIRRTNLLLALLELLDPATRRAVLLGCYVRPFDLGPEATAVAIELARTDDRPSPFWSSADAAAGAVLRLTIRLRLEVRGEADGRLGALTAGGGTAFVPYNDLVRRAGLGPSPVWLGPGPQPAVEEAILGRAEPLESLSIPVVDAPPQAKLATPLHGVAALSFSEPEGPWAAGRLVPFADVVSRCVRQDAVEWTCDPRLEPRAVYVCSRNASPEAVLETACAAIWARPRLVGAHLHLGVGDARPSGTDGASGEPSEWLRLLIRELAEPALALQDLVARQRGKPSLIWLLARPGAGLTGLWSPEAVREAEGQLSILRAPANARATAEAELWAGLEAGRYRATPALDVVASIDHMLVEDEAGQQPGARPPARYCLLLRDAATIGVDTIGGARIGQPKAERRGLEPPTPPTPERE
ncbi:MAG TPA: hypothetical protein PLD23_18230 [Armatimonadota bacterium]|nr:hypothetical protein [Armatimonadota bacterium]